MTQQDRNATSPTKDGSTPSAVPVRQRMRVRFTKQGDLRFVSHRDLVRALERMFRRVGVSLAMSEGFHPRPKMTFPDALSLGIAANNEVMDIVLAESMDPEDFKTRLNATSPDGLVVLDVTELGDGDRKAKIKQVTYEWNPGDFAYDKEALQQSLDALSAQDTLTIERKGKQIEIDLKETLDGLWLDDGRLMMNIRVVQQSQLQPRDILAQLGLADVTRQGGVLTRTRIELNS